LHGVGLFNNLHVETPLHQLFLGGQSSKREAGRERAKSRSGKKEIVSTLAGNI